MVTLLKNKLSLILAVILITLPLVVVFKSFFVHGSLAFGDAPHFFKESMDSLIKEPLSWSEKSVSFGGVNLFISLWPLMVLYGLVGKLIGNDLAIRAIFYFPSVILSIVGMWKLSKFLKLTKTARFFSIFLFTLNTYFILLIDGGVVGVALAYGLFPFTLLFGKRLSNSFTVDNFLIALVFLLLNTIADARVGVIALLTLALWVVLESPRKLRKIILLFVAWILLNSFWWLPTLLNITGSFGSINSSSSFISIIHSLTLFQPHWPNNDYGNINAPFFYFSLLPLFIFGFVYFLRRRQNYIFAIIFLIFAFLTKGDSFPLGKIYNYFISLPKPER